MEFKDYEKSVMDLLGSKDVVDVLEKKRELEKQLAQIINDLGDDLDKYQIKKEDAFRRYKEGQMEREEKTQTVIECDSMILFLQKERMKYADLRIKLNASFSL